MRQHPQASLLGLSLPLPSQALDPNADRGAQVALLEVPRQVRLLPGPLARGAGLAGRTIQDDRVDVAGGNPSIRRCRHRSPLASGSVQTLPLAGRRLHFVHPRPSVPFPLLRDELHRGDDGDARSQMPRELEAGNAVAAPETDGARSMTNKDHLLVSNLYFRKARKEEAARLDFILRFRF